MPLVLASPPMGITLAHLLAMNLKSLVSCKVPQNGDIIRAPDLSFSLLSGLLPIKELLIHSVYHQTFTILLPWPHPPVCHRGHYIYMIPLCICFLCIGEPSVGVAKSRKGGRQGGKRGNESQPKESANKGNGAAAEATGEEEDTDSKGLK